MFQKFRSACCTFHCIIACDYLTNFNWLEINKEISASIRMQIPRSQFTIRHRWRKRGSMKGGGGEIIGTMVVSLTVYTKQRRAWRTIVCTGCYETLVERTTRGPVRWIPWCSVTFPQARLFLCVRAILSACIYHAPAHADLRVCVHEAKGTAKRDMYLYLARQTCCSSVRRNRRST